MLGAAPRTLYVLLAAAGALAASPPTTAPVPTARSTPAAPRAISILGQAIAFLPSSVPAGTRTAPPVLVLLHGAGRDAQGMIRKFAREAEARGIVLLAPSSQNATWDVIGRALRVPMRDSSGKLDGPYEFRSTRDTQRVEAAIAELGKHVPVDRRRMVLAGFGRALSEAALRAFCDCTRFGTEALNAVDAVRQLGFTDTGKHTLSRDELTAQVRQGSIPLCSSTCSPLMGYQVDTPW